MKEAMRHIEVLIPASDRAQMTAELKRLQAIHIEIGEERPSAALGERLSDLETAIKDYDDFRKSHLGSSPSPKEVHADGYDLMALLNKRKRVLRDLAKREKDVEFWHRWGALDKAKLQDLSGAGIRMRLFRAKKKDIDAFRFPETCWMIPVFEEDGIIHFAMISRREDEKIPFDEVKLPRRDLKEASKERKKLIQQRKRIDADIFDIPHGNDLLQKAKQQVLLQIDHERVHNGYGELSKTPVLLMSGWCAASREKDIRAALEGECCSFHFRDPEESDHVPVLLKNNAYNRLFESITKIFQLPSYFEFDLTPFIAAFYPILFAYCLGDAGYGLVLFMAALFYMLQKKDWSNGLLGLVLGGSTMIIGLIKSGSVFGIPLKAGSELAWVNELAPLVIIPDDTSFLWNAFNVALIIGLVQILLGLIIAVVKALVYKGFVASLSFFGKLFIVLGAVGLFLLGDLEESRPILDATAQIMLYSGIGLVALFHDMSVRMIPRIASSVLPLFFIFTGLLGDVLSYVRLFALGVASAVLGLVVNQIGGQMWENGGLYIIGALLFLVLGHALNFALAALGSFVHPLRLTFVEFYNNAQFEGGGKPFKAFGTTSND